MPAKPTAVAALLASLCVPGPAVQAQGEPSNAPGEVTIGEQGSEQDPLAGRDRGLAADPETGPEVNQVEGILGVPAMSVKIDPRVLGVAPGDPLPSLRREGETIRKRDGRLLPTGDRGYAVFILDADPESDEPGDDQPLAMVVAPCITLESMERLLEDRGEDLRFTITGQVHTYRGVNYLLPTAQPKPWVVAEKQEAGDAVQQTTADPEPLPQPDAAEQDSPAEADSSSDQDVSEAGDAATPTADEVLEQLLNERRDAPDRLEPTTEPGPAEPVKLEQPAADALLTDPLLLGLDPDQPQAELKKEGEFLIARTGRLIRSADGAPRAVRARLGPARRARAAADHAGVQDAGDDGADRP